MPTLTNQEPDHYNLDYFHNKYSDRYSTLIRDTYSSQLKAMSFVFNPSVYNTTKTLHYFRIPEEPAIIHCYCQKYHTFFISNYLNILPRQTTPLLSQHSRAMNID